MPLITETYYLSLTQDNRGILRLRCSQDDTLRTVNLKLYNNGSIFVIPSGVSASISGVKQNGAVFSKPCTISQNRENVVLQLSSDITNVDGIIVAEIVLNDGEGGRLGTSNFIIQVEKNPIRAGVVQDTETPIEYINDFIEKIQTLTARLNNLITPSGDPSLAEVVDARIGILDNTTYQTLGARLNAEFQRLSNALSGITILESTGDTTDRTSEILSKLNAYGVCKLGKGDFYVNSLVMPEDSMLVGSGKSTRVILSTSVTSGYVVKPRSGCIIENISFYGGFTGTYSELIASGSSAQRHCIILDRFDSISSENVILNNIFINNFVGSAIIQRYTVGCHCEDVIIDMCYAGIDISNASYDGQLVNASMSNTRFGVVQNGSNFVFTNCVSKDSAQHIMSDQQNTECTFSSCTFSDSSLETTAKLANLSNARSGFVFDNCIFDSSLSMTLNACDGIVIKGTNFVGSDTFAITVSNSRNTLLLITDCIADVEPTVTNAGTAARITSCYLKDGTAWTISEADITVDDELSDESENPVQNKVINREISEIKADLGALDEKVDSMTGVLTPEIKEALLACIAHLGWDHSDDKQYYDALEEALYADNVSSIEAVLSLGTHTVYTTDNIESLRNFLTVTAHYTDETSAVVTGYELEGDISTAGTCEVTVKYGRTKRTTVSITVANNPTGILYEWDFTRGQEGLMDLRQGVTCTLEKSSDVDTLPTLDSNGVTFTNAQVVKLLSEDVQTGNLLFGKTIQVDVTSYTPAAATTGINNRLILFADDDEQYGPPGVKKWTDGFICHKNDGKWKIYNGQGWSTNAFSDMNSREAISGHTIGLYINSSGTCKLYVDGTSKGTVSGANLRKSHLYGFALGSWSVIGALYNATIAGVRIYNGEVAS